MRYALVNASDEVVNVIELEAGAKYTPPDGLKLVAGRDWPAAPSIPVPDPVPSFLAREFFALLTVADFSAIRNAVASNDALGLLWASLQAQGEAPISSTAERFLAGWAGLKQALPAERSSAIASSLGIPNA
jgi:hypothetical protein